jgi:hypothetical protein
VYEVKEQAPVTCSRVFITLSVSAKYAHESLNVDSLIGDKSYLMNIVLGTLLTIGRLEFTAVLL